MGSSKDKLLKELVLRFNEFGLFQDNLQDDALQFLDTSSTNLHVLMGAPLEALRKTAHRGGIQKSEHWDALRIKHVKSIGSLLQHPVEVFNNRVAVHIQSEVGSDITTEPIIFKAHLIIPSFNSNILMRKKFDQPGKDDLSTTPLIDVQFLTFERCWLYFDIQFTNISDSTVISQTGELVEKVADHLKTSVMKSLQLVDEKVFHFVTNLLFLPKTISKDEHPRKARITEIDSLLCKAGLLRDDYRLLDRPLRVHAFGVADH